MISRGWDGARRFLDEFRQERDEVLKAVSILDLAEALGDQIHDPGPRGTGLTCPSPEHPQSGHSAPASVFVGAEGYELWRCHGCGAGGTAIDFVLLAGHAEDYAEALDVLRDHAGSREPRSVPRLPSISGYQQPEDPERCHPIRGAADREPCEQWCAARDWYPGLDTLLAGRWSFVADQSGPWLRLFSDADRTWWQDRAIGGQVKPNGEPWRWRFPAGRSTELTVWEPNYIERIRERVYDHKRMAKYTVPKDLDHTPEVPPRVLVVEGGSDFITAVVAQGFLPIARLFRVVALPGAGRSDLLGDRDDWAVLVDNDEAGRRCREAIDAEQTVRHLYVPEQFKDLSEWWSSIDPFGQFHDGVTPPWERRKRWINEIRDALEGTPGARSSGVYARTPEDRQSKPIQRDAIPPPHPRPQRRRGRTRR